MKARLMVAALLATLWWVPQSMSTASAFYCYPGDPPVVYQACLDYNAGISQQVSNEQQLQHIHGLIGDVEAQLNAIAALMNSLKQKIAAQQALIAQTKAAIDDLNRKIRFGESELTRLQAHMSVRDELLNQRLRYIDAHGVFNYAELVLTSSNFNDLMNRMVAAQQIAASDRKLVVDLQQEHSLVAQANADLGVRRGQVEALLKQQQAAEAELQANLAAQAEAIQLEKKYEAQLSAQYTLIQQQRAAIDAQVAQLQQKYEAAARAAGGGTGQFAWPMPSCGHDCISQGFGCNSYWFEQYYDGCPYPHRIHTGIDIAGVWGSPIIAADTGVVYLYPGYYGYGNYVLMIHGNGYSTLYGHLSSFMPGLQSGTIVARGDVIAYEGSTGNSTGPHLHFEIRIDNAWKDPCLWLGC